LGVSLILQGIIMLLFPPEDPKRREVESKIDTSTYIFSNRVNNAVQGFPVPLVYGELRVGSNIISTNIVSEDMG
jgi:predicted phage tail protein